MPKDSAEFKIEYAPENIPTVCDIPIWLYFYKKILTGELVCTPAPPPLF